MTTRGLSGGFWQVQAVEKLQLFWGCGGDAVQRSFTDFRLVPLDPSQKFECGARAGTVALGFQAHPHDAVEHQGQEADQRVGPDPVRQAMVDGGDLDVGFEDAEARSISLKAL